VPPPGRVLVAFDNPTLVWSPSWTRLDATPNLVTSYTIDRGRQFEMDRTDTGRAVVEIADVDGSLDPDSGLYAGKLEPLRQIMLGRHNPITGTWHTRFRGFIEDYDYVFDPSQKVNRLTISCVDIFEILAAIEMQPGEFGDPPIAGADVYFARADQVYLRILQVLGDAGIPSNFHEIFSGNVKLYATSYSYGENVLTVIQDCADAEFPGVSNVYTDRTGRLVFHGRLAKFTPDTIASGAGSALWDYHEWDAADSAGSGAHVREFAYNRSLAKIINWASATPVYSNAKDSVAGVPPADAPGFDLTPDEVKHQLVKDAGSIGKYGIRSWSVQNLQTRQSNLDDVNALVETKRFAQYYVENYKNVHNRVSALGFRSMHPTWPRAAETWDMLSKIDIADSVNVSVGGAGSSGLSDSYFVEGIHETVQRLVPDMDDVTLTLDLSPRRYYESNPWA
jgi:hypothetical protein